MLITFKGIIEVEVEVDLGVDVGTTIETIDRHRQNDLFAELAKPKDMDIESVLNDVALLVGGEVTMHGIQSALIIHYD